MGNYNSFLIFIINKNEHDSIEDNPTHNYNNCLFAMLIDTLFLKRITPCFSTTDYNSYIMICPDFNINKIIASDFQNEYHGLKLKFNLENRKERVVEQSICPASNSYFCAINNGSELEDCKSQNVDLINLTNRELEILSLFGQGCTPLEISRALFITKDTVNYHKKKLLKKMRVNNINRLISLAAKIDYLVNVQITNKL